MRIRVIPKQPITVTVPQKPRILINQTQQIARSLNDFSDVDIRGVSDGDLLVYDEAEKKFVASNLLEKQVINGGNY